MSSSRDSYINRPDSFSVASSCQRNAICLLHSVVNRKSHPHTSFRSFFTPVPTSSVDSRNNNRQGRLRSVSKDGPASAQSTAHVKECLERSYKYSIAPQSCSETSIILVISSGGSLASFLHNAGNHHHL